MGQLCDVTGCRDEGDELTLTLQTSPPIDGGLMSKKVRLCKTHRAAPTVGVACLEGCPVRLVYDEREQ